MSAAKSTIESLYRLCSLLGVSTELDIRNPLASEHPWDAPRSFITLYESFIYLFKVVVSLAEAACRPLRGMQYCVYAAYGPTIRVFIGTLVLTVEIRIEVNPSLFSGLQRLLGIRIFMGHTISVINWVQSWSARVLRL